MTSLTSNPAAPDDVQLIPDENEPWLPSVLNLHTGAPAAAAALGAGVFGGWMNTDRGPLQSVLIGVFAAVLVLLAVIDLKTHRLPDAIVLPLYPVLCLAVAAGAAAGAIPGSAALTAAVSMAAVFTVLWLVAFFTGGLGFGDVKLGGVLGLVLGLESGYAAALGALILPMILGGMVALPMVFLGKRSQELAFGPYMVAGALLILLLPGSAALISQGALLR